MLLDAMIVISRTYTKLLLWNEMYFEVNLILFHAGKTAFIQMEILQFPHSSSFKGPTDYILTKNNIIIFITIISTTFR